MGVVEYGASGGILGAILGAMVGSATGSVGLATAVGAGVGVLTGGVYGYMSAAEAAAVNAATPSYSTPTVNDAAVSAATPYTQLTSTGTINPGSTYLLSASLPANASLAVAAAGATPGLVSPGALQALQALGFTVNQVWTPGTVPSNWPSTDSSTTEARASVTYSGATAISLATVVTALQTYGTSLQGVNVFSTGS